MSKSKNENEEFNKKHPSEKNSEALDKSEAVSDESENVLEKAEDPIEKANAGISVKPEKKSDESKDKKSKKIEGGRSKRLKHGTLSVVFTIFFVAAVVLINVVFNLVLDRFDISADLSDQSIYSIDESTEEYLAEIDDSVSFIVTADQTAFENSYEYYKQVSEITKKFAAANGRFTLEYKDLDENPSFYSSYGATLSAASIIVQSENTGRYVILTSSDYLSPKYYFQGEEISYSQFTTMYNMGYSSYMSAEYYTAAEQSLLTAVMSVTDTDPVRVAFVTGYGMSESSIPSSLQSLLTSNAYTVETLDIELAEEIDSDIDYLIIYAPIYDYSEDKLNLIDIWLDNGGNYDKNLMYIPASTVDILPNLNALLQDWGMQLESGRVYQTDSNYSIIGNKFYQYFEIDSDTYGTKTDVSTKSTFGGYMNPITLLFEEYSNYYVQSIVKSYDGAVVVPFESEDWDINQAEDYDSYVVAAESAKYYYDSNNEKHISKLIVVSGETFVSDDCLTSPSYNNADLLLDIFNVSSGKDDIKVSVTPVVFGATTFDISGAQAQAITIVFAAAIPILIIVIGIVVIIRRKRR